MDNLDKIKFKEAGNGWYFKIDLDSGDKINFPKKHGYYKEMQAWVEAGNEIEPQYTSDELAQKESEDMQNAIESQRQNCIQLLNESEKSVSNDPPYPDDIEIWKTIREQWRDIIKSDQIESIPEKPF